MRRKKNVSQIGFNSELKSPREVHWDLAAAPNVLIKQKIKQKFVISLCRKLKGKWITKKNYNHGVPQQISKIIKNCTHCLDQTMICWSPYFFKSSIDFPLFLIALIDLSNIGLISVSIVRKEEMVIWITSLMKWEGTYTWKRMDFNSIYCQLSLVVGKLLYEKVHKLWLIETTISWDSDPICQTVYPVVCILNHLTNKWVSRPQRHLNFPPNQV